MRVQDTGLFDLVLGWILCSNETFAKIINLLLLYLFFDNFDMLSRGQVIVRRFLAFFIVKLYVCLFKIVLVASFN